MGWVQPVQVRVRVVWVRVRVVWVQVLSRVRLSSCGISDDCVRSMLELAGSVGNLAELDLGNNGSCQRSTFLLNPHSITHSR